VVSKKVYIVTSGSYSDYSIDRVFDDKVLADEYVRIHTEHGGYDMRVEEYDVNAALPRIEIIYTVEVDETGEEVCRRSSACDEPEWTSHESSGESYRRDAIARGGSTRGYDVALKIARDKLAEMKAQREGI
jgi:hypothetical protein